MRVSPGVAPAVSTAAATAPTRPRGAATAEGRDGPRTVRARAARRPRGPLRRAPHTAHDAGAAGHGRWMAGPSRCDAGLATAPRDATGYAGFAGRSARRRLRASARGTASAAGVGSPAQAARRHLLPAPEPRKARCPRGRHSGSGSQGSRRPGLPTRRRRRSARTGMDGAPADSPRCLFPPVVRAPHDGAPCLADRVSAPGTAAVRQRATHRPGVLRAAGRTGQGPAAPAYREGVRSDGPESAPLAPSFVFRAPQTA